MATKILLIDDNKDVREMLREELVAAGYEVTAVANGNAGLAAVRKAPVDIVVTDIFMPEKEGLETIVEMRRDFPQIKIIAISGGSSRPRNQRTDHLAIAHDIGADEILRKPFEPAQLVGAIERLIG